MPTLKQLLKLPREKQKHKSCSLALQKCAQKKGICIKIYSMSPKKPNSAERKVAKLKLTTGKVIIGYIPGEKHSLQEHAVVLVRGGRVKDLPGVSYHLVRGAFDFSPVILRKNGRSKYGTKIN